MYRGTTPTHTFDIPFLSTELSELTISYLQDGKVVLQKSLEDCIVEDYVVKVTLTKADTCEFKHTFPVMVQLQITTTGGKTYVDNVSTFNAKRNATIDAMDTEHEPVDPEEFVINLENEYYNDRKYTSDKTLQEVLNAFTSKKELYLNWRPKLQPEIKRKVNYIQFIDGVYKVYDTGRFHIDGEILEEYMIGWN